MVFHRSLSYSKSPQVSMTLLSILPDTNNALVWMVSTCPLISKSSSPCTNLLVSVPSTLITIGITVSFVLEQGLVTCLSFSFLSILPHGQPEWQSSLFGRFSFFCYYHLVWLSGRDYLIHVYHHYYHYYYPSLLY